MPEGKKSSVLKYVLLAVIALAIIGAIVGKDRKGATGGTGGSPSAGSAAATLPSSQAAFVRAVEEFVPKYKAAPNELKKSALRTERAARIRDVLGGATEVKGWIGTLSKMSTNGDGKAIVEVEFPSSVITVKTWNNAVSDVGDGTLIPQDSPLFGKIANLSEGQAVEFSGSFVPFHQDFVREASVTENGSMTEPEFIFRFASIRSK